MNKRTIVASLINVANELDIYTLHDDADVVTRIAQAIYDSGMENDTSSDIMDSQSDQYEQELAFFDAEAELKKTIESFLASGQPINSDDFDAYKMVLGPEYVDELVNKAQFVYDLENNGATVLN